MYKAPNNMHLYQNHGIYIHMFICRFNNHEIHTPHKSPGKHPQQIKAGTKNENDSQGIPVQHFHPDLYLQLLQ